MSPQASPQITRTRRPHAQIVDVPLGQANLRRAFPVAPVSFLGEPQSFRTGVCLRIGRQRVLIILWRGVKAVR